MPDTLQQLLAQQSPSTAGVHEAVAQHSESIFEEFHGILPFFLGKRRRGTFIQLSLPKNVTEDTEALLQTVSDLILVYELKLASFVSAVRMRDRKTGLAKIGAMLLTADNAGNSFQLHWEMEFDGNSDISSARRSDGEATVIPTEVWQQIFSQKQEAEAKTFCHERLVSRFGGPDSIPKL